MPSSASFHNLDSKADPTCGHCGKKLSNHYHEDQIYCYHDTTGDLFSAEPTDETIGEMLAERHPDLYLELTKVWKILNGHNPE